MFERKHCGILLSSRGEVVGMYKIELRENGKSKIIFAENGENLLSLLLDNGYNIPTDCGRVGKCRKCIVKVDGETILSCEYNISKDITVDLPLISQNCNLKSQILSDKKVVDAEIAVDIGSTTVAMSFFGDDKTILKKTVFLNPQRKFGADVMSRIDYCTKNNIKDLQIELIEKLKYEINIFCNEFSLRSISKMVVCANTVILHTFFGIDCSSMGVSPYNPSFLESRQVSGSDVGLSNVKNIVSFPCASSFFGADAVGGIEYINSRNPKKPYLFLDLGTNAEIAIVTESGVTCTSAAAGPCFEGAEISCGVGAIDGAIKSVNISNGELRFETVNDKEPIGICGSGLIDTVSELLKNFIIDKSGTFTDDIDEFELTDKISVSQDDIRKFQNAKSAVRSAVETLLAKSGLNADVIETVYIAGGFSENINAENFCGSGLIDSLLSKKCQSVSNTSLASAEMVVRGELSINSSANRYQYIDLNADSMFSELFIKHMDF